MGWDAALERICTWARLKDLETNSFFWVFNTHFDHRGKQARLKSAELILETIALKNEKLDYPVILMGDLNAPSHSNVIKTLLTKLRDSYTIAKIKSGPVGTWNGFKPAEEPGDRIDYLLVSPHFSVETYSTPAPLVEGRYLSDHFPVKARLMFTPE